MNPQFNDIQTRPENEIFRVVFFPDRIYHAAYLNASISRRYRYYVDEVRSKHDITIIKGTVFLDERRLTNFLRIEYRASRLNEQVRDAGRFLGDTIIGWVSLPDADGDGPMARVKLGYCQYIRAFQVEMWQSLAAPSGSRHDFRVLKMMGRNGAITRVSEFTNALNELKSIQDVRVAFRENDVDHPIGFRIPEDQAKWDNNYLRSHQDPRTQVPNSSENTIADNAYDLYFQRGWFLDANQVAPVNYRNAMMDGENPERVPDNLPPDDPTNIVRMRWIVQRELGGSIVYFHHVTVEPGAYEGSHQHVGSEELYYFTGGNGIAYMGDGDDPATDHYPTVVKAVFGLGERRMKEIPVRAGHVIFTKSGGMHGVRNPGPDPLTFVAFGYHSS